MNWVVDIDDCNIANYESFMFGNRFTERLRLTYHNTNTTLWAAMP